MLIAQLSVPLLLTGEARKQKKFAAVRDDGTAECQAKIAALEAEGYKVVVITREKGNY
jgi:hypothetical protein